MSKVNKTVIFFDASLRNGLVGIGIFNFSDMAKKFLSFQVNHTDAYLGEKAALICSMEYAHNIGVKYPIFCTDNSILANEGISPKLLEKYPFEIKPKLIWIPRELNEEADKLSKSGSSANNSLELELKISVNNVVLKRLASYSFQRRINFLRRMANCQFEMEIVRMLEKGTKEHYNFQYKNDLKPFLLLINNIILAEEKTAYVRERLKKVFKKANKKDTDFLTEKEFDSFVRKRNMI